MAKSCSEITVISLQDSVTKPSKCEEFLSLYKNSSHIEDFRVNIFTLPLAKKYPSTCEESLRKMHKFLTRTVVHVLRISPFS